MNTRISLLALFFLSGASFANSLELDYGSTFNVSTSLGWLNGESKEYVYDPSTGRKISQLNWDIKNVAIAKASVSMDIWDWLTLNAQGWVSLNSGSSEMDDYDWLSDRQSHWTDWSHHEDTKLNYANEYDVNLKGWLLRGEHYRVGPVIGFQQTRFSWTAKGGKYNYNNGSLIGSFPSGMKGIGYKQKFSAPYIGLAGQYTEDNIEVSALLKFSDWATAKDNDEHYARSLSFREKANNTRYYSATIGVGYYLTPQAKIFTDFNYSRYQNGKGSTDILDRETGDRLHIGGDSAGIANETYSVNAGLDYRF